MKLVLRVAIFAATALLVLSLASLHARYDRSSGWKPEWTPGWSELHAKATDSLLSALKVLDLKGAETAPELAGVPSGAALSGDAASPADSDDGATIARPENLATGGDGAVLPVSESAGAKGMFKEDDLDSKAVVMARREQDDVSWVFRELPEWTAMIYTCNSTSSQNSLGTLAPDRTYHTPLNKGHESVAYLLFIVENYARLPNTMAFIHSHERGYPAAWHTDNYIYSNAESLRTLRLPYIQKVGYSNLRCNTDVGCPAEVQPFRHDASRSAEVAMAEAWMAMFPTEGGEAAEEVVPKILATPCCGQFAVSRAQVLARPRSDYQRYLDWLLKSDLEDDVTGRVFEYIWHVIFGKDAVHCPAAEQCYCNVYGRC